MADESTEGLATLDDFLVEEPEGDPDDEAVDDGGEEAAEEIDDQSAEAGEDEGEDEEDEEGDDESDGEDEDDEEADAVPAPVSWSKEDAEVFKGLPSEAQQVITRREAERDKYVREAGRKASEARNEVENSAREIIAKQAEDHAQALGVYAQQFMPKEPDQQLLYTGNPDDVLTYQRQDAAYRAATAQQQQLQQEVQRAQQQAEQARQEAGQADVQADADRLKEHLPEWFDPSEGPELRKNLRSTGSELGYPEELMAQASSQDILALHKAHEWKAKAEKFDKLNARKMKSVRAAKKLPKMGRPGSTPGKGAKARQSGQRRDEAMKSFANTRSGDAAAALLLERKR